MRLSLLVLVGPTLQPESLRGDHPFAFVQKPAFFGAAGHEERSSQTDDNCKQPLKEEDVTPGVDDNA